MLRRSAAILSLLGLGALLAGLAAAPAQAAGYRYWSFWQAEGGAWNYATEGPATARPADGAVDGYRFSVSEDSGDAATPREAPDFEAVCGTTPAAAGTKRVAVVIDPGTPEDAPSGQRPPAPRSACAQVGTDATSAEALAQVAKPLRYDGSALLCAIGGYPRTGCGEQVDPSGTEAGSAEASASAPESGSASGGTGSGDDGQGPSLGVWAGMAAVLGLGGAALWRARRRRG
ncbi:SCO2322 family protein [Streptomyces sp. C10-9-1]|uniref:SCO2322 family protein n=1 Tax=Streptomyces sp. C10-9-1 TaxID=1859285 RepID=UPI0021132767|nr:SCO2322 family protein [Streptomyces sp. C10-9-1]MCQ6553594.1 SCO2322 family protein [Streptomyces sp. C10-9-1]